MMTYTKLQLDSLAAKPGPSTQSAGATSSDRTLSLFFPVFGKDLDIDVEIASDQAGLGGSTVQTINDILQWTSAERARITRMLFEHAAMTRTEVDFGIAPDDPRHPCHFEAGLDSVDAKVEFDSITIYETEGLRNRFALVNCLPAWEQEHGVAIIVKNGQPFLLGDFQDDLAPFDD